MDSLSSCCGTLSGLFSLEISRRLGSRVREFGWFVGPDGDGDPERGGIAYRADVRIDASVDVSREHARIRRDPRTGAFFLIDLSTLGTTLNGQRVPKGYDDVDGTKRENGVETPLPSGSKIGLADTVFVQFEIADRS